MSDVGDVTYGMWPEDRDLRFGEWAEEAIEQELRTRVKAGAEVLDMQVPGWRRMVDRGELDMSTGCKCVLGQLFDDYGRGARSVLGCVPPGSFDMMAARAHGFTVEDYGLYPVLDGLWAEQLD